MIGTAIRIALTVVMLGYTWRQAPWAVALPITLLAANTEITAWALRQHHKLIALLVVTKK